MATLLEKLQGQMGQKKQAKFSGEAQRAAELLRAKSGKALGTAGPQASSLAEKARVAETQAGLDQQALQQQLAGQQIGVQAEAQEEQQARAMEGAQLAERGRQVEAQLREDQILGEFERGTRRLDNAGDIAAMEQLGHKARMENTQYVDNLLREGARKRLDDEAAFREELQKDVFADMRGLFTDELEFQEAMAMSDSEFKKRMANLDLGYAMDIAKQAQRAERTRAQYEGLGAAASAGAQYYASRPADTASESSYRGGGDTRYGQSEMPDKPLATGRR